MLAKVNAASRSWHITLNTNKIARFPLHPTPELETASEGYGPGEEWTFTNNLVQKIIMLNIIM